MITSKLKEKLINHIYCACVEHLGLLKNDLQGQSIFAYSIFGYSGFDSISVAACTREGLDEHYEKAKDIVKCPYSWFEVNGSEWSYLYHHNEVFASTNEYLDYLNENDLFMDNGSDFRQFTEAFYTDVMVTVLNKLKSDGFFNDECFENDILLGVQFADPDPDIFSCLLKISEQVNTNYWHSKIKDNFDV
jgi:hypothetical protein